MKKLWILAVAVLAVAGCAQPVKETPAAEKTANETQTTDAEHYGEALAAAFADKGYAVTDVERERDEYSFDADRLEVTVTTRNAAAEYADESYGGTIEKTDDNHEIATVPDRENGDYELAALDKKNEVLYEISDVHEGDLDPVKEILTAIGF